MLNCDPRGGVNFDHRGIIWKTLVEDLQIMPYTKYERYGSCCFRQEDVWKCIFKTYFVTQWPHYATNRNGLKKFGSGTPRDHLCEVWSKSNEWSQRRSRLNENVYARTHAPADDGQRTKDCHNSSLWALCGKL